MDALICHLSSWDSAEDQRPYQTALDVQLQGKRVRGLLDSGNLWRSAISYHLYRSLPSPPKLTKTRFNFVSTAKDGSRLRVLGQVDPPMTLTIPGTNLNYDFQPVVIDNLSMDLNFSGPWMKRQGWDQLHSSNRLQIGRQIVPLKTMQAALTRPSQLPKATHAAYVASLTTIPGHSGKVVALRKPRTTSPEESSTQARDGLLTAWRPTALKTGLQLPESSLVSVPAERDGLFSVWVVNPHEDAVTLQRGQQLGEVEEVEVVDASAGGLHHIKPTPAGKGAQTWPLQRRREWLIREFKLKEKKCLQPPGHLEKALQLLLKYWNFFSHDGSFGKTHLLQHRIITEDVPPIKCKIRPVGPAYEDDLRQQINHLLEQDVIEPADSPWSANLVPVKKKNGNIRWCVDWRRLNAVTKKDAYPMPNVHDCLARLAGSTIFSGVDMAGAFHCIELDPRDREKTAFATPFGSFQQKRLGFGLTNGPSAYCRLVEKVLRGIPPTVAIGFMDDGVIHSSDFATHLTNLDITLAAYQAGGLKLSPAKCDFFAEKITFLGHEVSAAGVRPTEEHVKAVKDWPLPRLKTEIRSFLGAVGYYSEHIADYAQLAAPWFEVMGKTTKEDEKKELTITPVMKANFHELKQRLITRPVLGLPYFKGPKAGRFILDTDFCHLQIAAVLSQLQGDQEVVLAYGSKKLNSAQRNYASHKGELLAGQEYMQKYRYYLQGQHFLWRTDNKALEQNLSMKNPSSVIARWLAILADFSFDVQHRPGKQHVVADALSRHGAGEPADPEGTEEEVKTVTQGVPQLAAMAMPAPSTGELLDAQLGDEDLMLVRKWVETDTPPTGPELKRCSEAAKKYAGQLERLSLDQKGLLQRRSDVFDGREYQFHWCLPRSLLEATIHAAHEIGGHMSGDKTAKRVATKFYFPSLRRETEAQLRFCRECQAKGKGPQLQRHTLLDGSTGYPFQKVHIDYMGPFNPGDVTGAKWLLTLKDPFSKWVEAIPVRDSTAESTISALNKEVFARFGYPEQIHTDQGPQFMSHLFKDYCSDLNVKHTTTLGYNPKSNGQVERMHRDLATIIRALTSCEDSDGAWESVLPQALFALRTTVSEATGLSPHQVLFGREASQPLDLLFGNPNHDLAAAMEAPEYLADLRRRQAAAQSFVRENLAKAIVRQRRQYNKEKKHFRIGAKVWCYDPRLDPTKNRKFARVFSGPWIVSSSPDNHELYVRIEPDPSWASPRHRGAVVSIDRLKPYLSERVVPGSHDPTRPEDEHGEFTPLPRRGPRRRRFSQTDASSDSDDDDQPRRKRSNGVRSHHAPTASDDEEETYWGPVGGAVPGDGAAPAAVVVPVAPQGPGAPAAPAAVGADGAVAVAPRQPPNDGHDGAAAAVPDGDGAANVPAARAIDGAAAADGDGAAPAPPRDDQQVPVPALGNPVAAPERVPQENPAADVGEDGAARARGTPPASPRMAAPTPTTTRERPTASSRRVPTGAVRRTRIAATPFRVTSSSSEDERPGIMKTKQRLAATPRRVEGQRCTPTFTFHDEYHDDFQQELGRRYPREDTPEPGAEAQATGGEPPSRPLAGSQTTGREASPEQGTPAGEEADLPRRQLAFEEQEKPKTPDNPFKGRSLARSPTGEVNPFQGRSLARSPAPPARGTPSPRLAHALRIASRRHVKPAAEALPITAGAQAGRGAVPKRAQPGRSRGRGRPPGRARAARDPPFAGGRAAAQVEPRDPSTRVKSNVNYKDPSTEEE